jgi:hypothetical protein
MSIIADAIHALNAFTGSPPATDRIYALLRMWRHYPELTAGQIQHIWHYYEQRGELAHCPVCATRATRWPDGGITCHELLNVTMTPADVTAERKARATCDADALAQAHTPREAS